MHATAQDINEIFTDTIRIIRPSSPPIPSSTIIIRIITNHAIVSYVYTSCYKYGSRAVNIYTLCEVGQNDKPHKHTTKNGVRININVKDSLAFSGTCGFVVENGFLAAPRNGGPKSIKISSSTVCVNDRQQLTYLRT